MSNVLRRDEDLPCLATVAEVLWIVRMISEVGTGQFVNQLEWTKRYVCVL
jgi:hypothetical protein